MSGTLHAQESRHHHLLPKPIRTFVGTSINLQELARSFLRRSLMATQSLYHADLKTLKILITQMARVGNTRSGEQEKG